MRIKPVVKRIRAERQNTRDNFRVNYKDRKDFDVLKVSVNAEGEQRIQVFYFLSGDLPNRDSIHFTTSLEKGKLVVTWRGVQPRTTPPPTIMQLAPEWFQAGYYVYIVHIVYKSINYFYIGMTGDRKHLVARSPFYRMTGHFNKQVRSTENHIIKGLQERVKNAHSIDEVLTRSTITYYSYLVREVSPGMEHHHEKRKYVESVESALISRMRDIYGNNAVFNHRRSSVDIVSGAATAAEIMADLQKQINRSQKKSSR